VRSFPVASSSLAAFKEPAADISHLKANRHRNQRNGKNHHHAYSRAHKAEKLFAAADKRDKQKMYSIIAFFAILAVSHSLSPPAFFRIYYISFLANVANRYQFKRNTIFYHTRFFTRNYHFG
jgi:hypothetical protein